MKKTTLTDSERAVKSNAEHRAIVNAIKERNAGKASELATLHIYNAVSNIANHGYFEN